MRSVGFKYHDSVQSELNLKQAFNSFNDAVRASSMNSFFKFLIFCLISVFHIYLCVSRRGGFIIFIDYIEDCLVVIPSRYKKTVAISIHFHYLSISLQYLSLRTQRCLGKMKYVKNFESPYDLRSEVSRYVLQNILQFVIDYSALLLEYRQIVSLLVVGLSARQYGRFVSAKV